MDRTKTKKTDRDSGPVGEIRPTVITIRLPKDSVSMLFTNPAMAHEHYNAIRGQGIFGGQWISSIEIS
jgi:hypothetical protein